MTAPYMFGVGHRVLPYEVAKVVLEIAEKHGATFEQADLPGQGYTHWFRKPNEGEPFDSGVAREVLSAVAFAGIDLNDDDTVTVETMPDHLRDSHRAARNFGTFPANGAVRQRVTRDEAEQIIADDPDGYARIVGGGQ